MKSPANIYDVAKAAGVSPAAVSSVLNGRGRVSADTERVIREAIESLGYQPRPHPARRRNLSPGGEAGRSGRGLVLLLVGDERIGASQTYQMRRITAGAAEWLAEFNLDVILGALPPEGEPLQGLDNPHLKGVLLRHGPRLDGLLEELRAIPCVEFFSARRGGPWDQVAVDNVALAEQALEHLVARGCRQVVVLNPDAAHPEFHLRASALEFRARAAGLACACFSVRDGESLLPRFPAVPEAGRLGLFVAGYNEPNNPVALERALEACGLLGHPDVEIVGASPTPQRHATVGVSLETLGRHCAEQLVWRMQHASTEPSRRLLRPRLMAGGLSDSEQHPRFSATADKEP